MAATFHPVQIAKRLVEADGYLELGMPAQALERLQPLSTDGQFGGLVSYMRGHALQAHALQAHALQAHALQAHALQAEDNFEAAASALETAAKELPEHLARQIWLELSECYRRAGFISHAVNSLGSARGASNTPAPGAGEKL